MDPAAPSPTDVQIDKRDGEWLLTYWLSQETTLRIRIRHVAMLDPDEFVCEIADAITAHEFRPLTRLFWHRDDDAETYEWPVPFRRQFIELAQVWSACLALAEWGLALGDTPVVEENPTGDTQAATEIPERANA